MENPSPENQNQPAQAQQPEVLKPRAESAAAPPPPGGDKGKPARRGTYRLSHRATLIGVAVVLAILAVNGGILAFVLKNQAKTKSLINGQVTISSSTLDKLGVNRTAVGDSGIQLNVGPDAQFNGKVTVAGAVSIAGQLKLNSEFIASSATLTQLQASNAALAQLNVNGDSTLSNLNLRGGLIVTGATQLQGSVIVGQLLTVDNNLTVVGNLAVGGVLSVNTFSANSLTSTSTLSIGGHVITGGTTPGVGPGGPALGSNGTVSISGNDSAGRIAINIGVSAVAGTLANVAFHNQYSSVPRIIISAINIPSSVTCGFYVLNPSVAGFSVEDSFSLPPGGYAIDYIVEQ